MVVGTNGDLFGTTAYGGPYGNFEYEGDGTVFEIAKTAEGYADTPVMLAGLGDGNTGDLPNSLLIGDANGDLFGTASDTLFEIAKTATGYADAPITLAGFSPYYIGTHSLIVDGSGNFFGSPAETVGCREGEAAPHRSA